MIRSSLALSAFLSLCALPAFAATPDVVLKGRITGADNQTYLELPFTVPAGVDRLTVTFRYTGRDNRTTIDLGLDDPNGFRGWSGGNKPAFTVGEADATPSYLPGRIVAGTWKLIVGVPNIRADQTSDYEADIAFGHPGDTVAVSAFADAPLKAGPSWYRGDFHSHSAHSDGSCDSLGGRRVPCPVFLTLQAAKARGLDFIVLSDHNAISQYSSERELQPYFDTLLLIPGREITTFHGHANVFGTTEFLPFRLGSPGLPSLQTLIDAVHARGALISINHPASPSGENCMGCGWTAPVDFGQVDAIEVVNGGSVHAQGGHVTGPLDGIPFWEARLNAGFHLTAIGGSDNHDASAPPARQTLVGYPTTVIHADNLSQAALFDGLKKGRVFVDMGMGADRVLDLKATSEKNSAVMGETLAVSPNSGVLVDAEVNGAPGTRLEVIVDGKVQPKLYPVADSRSHIQFQLAPAAIGAQWVRVNIVNAAGDVEMISNPIYLNMIKK